MVIAHLFSIAGAGRQKKPIQRPGFCTFNASRLPDSSIFGLGDYIKELTHVPSIDHGRQPGFETGADSSCQATIHQRPSFGAARSGVACSTSDKLAYVLPKVEQSVSNNAFLPNVVAEWSGLTPTLRSSDVAAGSPTSHRQNDSSFDWRTPKPTSIRSAFWKRQDDVLEFPIDRAALLFHPEMQLLCQLNETAFFIWRNCNDRCVEDLALMLTDAFHVEIDTATDHVMRIIELFSISGFVVEESFHAVPS